MIKNENLTEISKSIDCQRVLTFESDKENKENNISRKITNDIKTILNKRKEEKTFFVKSNINKNNFILKPKENTKTYKKIINDNKKIEKDKIKSIFFNKKLDEKNKLSVEKTLDYFNESLGDINKIRKKNSPKVIKYNLSESNYKILNKESSKKFNHIFPSFINKKINNISKTNKLYKSLVLENKIITGPFKYTNDSKQENNINNNEKKDKLINPYFNFIINKNRLKNEIKSISLENSYNLKKVEFNDYVNKEEKEKKISILEKYSKVHKIINEKENIQNKELKEQIIKNICKDNLKEEEDDKNIEFGDIKDIDENKNLPRGIFFKKIIEEIKDVNNNFQNIPYYRIKSQRENMSKSLSNTKLKEYDTNSFREITIKKIKNPLHISITKENKNYSTHNTSRGTLKNDYNENNNKTNCSSSSIFNNNKNLNNDLLKIEKDNNKKFSIKIKKIPLNKLKNSIKIKNIKVNFHPRANNIPRIYPTQNNYTTNNSLIKENNTCLMGYIQNCKKFKYINNKIPRNNNSINIPYKKNLSINNEFIESKNEKNHKAIYSKVNLKKMIFSKINNNFNKINTDNNLLKTNNSNTNINISNNNLYINRSQKKINFNSGKNTIERNTNINQITTRHLTKAVNISDLNESKIIKEKNIGLFKKKLTKIKRPNIIEFKNISFNNLFNNKINNTIFNAFISNKNQNQNINDSCKYNSFIKMNNRTNDSIGLINYESNLYENIKKCGGCQSLSSKTSNNMTNSIINNNNCLNSEIKLEQVISLLNFEDLLIIEDKINIILKNLKNGKKNSEELFDLWNYLFSSALYSKLDQIFKYFLEEAEEMKLFINYSLLLIIICYDFSFNSNTKNSNINFSLFETLRLIYINLLIVISSMKNKIKSENKDVYNLRLIEMSNIDEIIGQNLINFNNSTYNENDISFYQELLNNNTNLLIKNISLIIKNYKDKNIINLFYDIKTNSLDEINNFFRKKVIREDFLGCSILASSFLKENQNLTPAKIPYITSKNKKKYSLVLDLDETLVHFKINHGQNEEGVLKLRPGVFTFLEKVKELYEIILFTEASEAYTELIMEAFNKKKYFDYKFYRQHTIIIGQDFVKDLQRIGRPLDKVIIIDNIPQNYRMQKANGINIKPFFGEDQNDQVLIYLFPILINIAKNNIDTRNGLIKYKDEIITKITSNLFNRINNENY